MSPTEDRHPPAIITGRLPYLFTRMLLMGPRGGGEDISSIRPSLYSSVFHHQRAPVPLQELRSKYKKAASYFSGCCTAVDELLKLPGRIQYSDTQFLSVLTFTVEWTNPLLSNNLNLALSGEGSAGL